jgi:hypothetical protein
MNAAERREAALKRGVDELQNLLEYALRNRPRALQFARGRYVKFAVKLYREIATARR